MEIQSYQLTSESLRNSIAKVNAAVGLPLIARPVVHGCDIKLDFLLAMQRIRFGSMAGRCQVGGAQLWKSAANLCQPVVEFTPVP
jgi:hypothetical protein